jgi:hypothetical protein
MPMCESSRECAVKSSRSATTYPPIHLIRYTDGTLIVRIEVDGQWVDVIRESGEIVSHIIEPAGIEAAIARTK